MHPKFAPEVWFHNGATLTLQIYRMQAGFQLLDTLGLKKKEKGYKKKITPPPPKKKTQWLIRVIEHDPKSETQKLICIVMLNQSHFIMDA